MISRYSRVWLWLLAALLYGGPMLAGLARHGWTVLPVFAALCLLHASVIHKPDLTNVAGRMGMILLALEQIALVAILWGAGLALARFGMAIMLPLWAPVLVSALAAGVSAWAFRDAAEMDVMLESLLASLSRMTTDELPRATKGAWPKPHPETLLSLHARLDALRALESWDQGTVDLIVQGLTDDVGAEAFDPFYDLAGAEPPANEPVIDYALLRYMAEDMVMQALMTRGEAALAPMLLLNAPDARVRAEARDRLRALIALGTPRTRMPDPDWLRQLAEVYIGEGYDALADDVAALK